MDTKDIRAFMRSFETRSINKAAIDLFISPQGLGKQISRLEAELEVKLFERSSSGLIPTDSGEYLYKKCIGLMQQIQDITQGIKNVREEVKRFHIGYSCGVSNVMDVVQFEHFRHRHPNLNITWIEDANTEIRKRAAAEKYDVAFIIGSMVSENVHQETLLNLKYSAIVHPDHPFYSRESISIEDLRGEELITLNEKYQSYYNIVQRCQDFGFTPNIRFKTMESSRIYQLASQGLGIGIDVNIHGDSIKHLPVKLIEISDSIPWTVKLVCSREKASDPIIQELREIVLTNV